MGRWPRRSWRACGPYARAVGLRGLAEFDLGREKADFRVPDAGWVDRDAPPARYVPTAAVVLDVLSPDDETYAKLGFYAVHGVREVLVAHPGQRWVHCHASAQAGAAPPRARSKVFGLQMADLEAMLDWPTAAGA